MTNHHVAGNLIDRAWQSYHQGDSSSALQLAQEAYSAGGIDASTASALGFFLLEAGEHEKAHPILLAAARQWARHAVLQWHAGIVELHSGNTASGIELLRRACTIDPNLHEAAFRLAWALHDAGNLDEAVYWASLALRAQQSNPHYLLQTGWLLHRLGRYEEAINSYRQAISSYPKEAQELGELYHHLAECQMLQGEKTAALHTLEEGLARFPGDPNLETLSAQINWQSGNQKTAIDIARRLSAADTESVANWYLLGAFLQDSGDWQAADACFAEVQKRDLSHFEALFRRAQIQARERRFVDAHWLLQQVLNIRPQFEAASHLMIQVLLEMQQATDARRLLVPRLRVDCRHSDYWRLLAIVHNQRGCGIPARKALARSLRLNPDNVEALRMLVWIALEQKNITVALQTVDRLLGMLPHDVSAQIQGAFVYSAAQNNVRASIFAEKAVAAEPDNAEAWRSLAQVRYQQRRLNEAEEAIEVALKLAPDRLDSLRQLGWIFVAQQNFAQAELVFLQAHDKAPRDPVALLELAEVRLRAGQFAAGLDAIAALRRLGRLSPQALLLCARLLVEGGQAQGKSIWHAEALVICRKLFADLSQHSPVAEILVRLLGLGIDAARPLFEMLAYSIQRHALQQALNFAITHHGHSYVAKLAEIAQRDFPDQPWLKLAGLYVDSLSTSIPPAELAWKARSAYRALKLQNGLTANWARPRRAGSRLRLAYLAGQAHERLLLSVLANHDPAQVEIFVFTNLELKNLPAHVRCQPLDFAHLASACNANQIDAVIDAGGFHPFEGQYSLLEAYAKRLAPLQIAWLGSYGSSGGLFDVLLTDDCCVGQADEANYDEAIWRLQGGQWSWSPPLYAPSPMKLPAISNGYVTFGITARGLRLNQESLNGYAKILQAIPSARLRFIGMPSADWSQRAEILSALKNEGIDGARIEFDRSCNYEEFLTWFQKIDIVLDSFPGNGGLSLIDALWMGVPVITRSGDWIGARQGKSILSSLGLDSWVATSSADFVAKAQELAGDTSRLKQTRNELRQGMLNSPLLDGRRVAGQIESLCAAYFKKHRVANSGGDIKQQVRNHAQRSLQGWLDKPDACIELPRIAADEVPTLSVVVVLYNQAGLSLRTLQALADQRGVRFETIVIDNASHDQTSELLARTHGARIVRNSTNQGFLLAANQGASMASGKYLLLLNNDAVVQEGALAATSKRLQEDPEIGALGGRIVLTSGGLQEVGNFIFQDGSTAGIGRGSDPFSPPALMRRYADYCSGVFLAVPLMLWRMLDGFDQDFAPAYYEDTDFCLRIWQAGFRVVCAPEILVEHLEWGSAASNEAVHHMQKNRVLFQGKHKNWLAKQPLPKQISFDGDHWCSPVDRPRKPRILILDNEVPHMSRGGGLPRARLILQSLQDWPVTFFPLWSSDDDWRKVHASIPDTTEVMLGHGIAQLEQFLERRSGVYDVLWVSRPPNLQALAPLRRRRPELFAGMQVIYDSEALFALREIGEQAVKGHPMTRAQANARLDQELRLVTGNERIVVVSERDARPFRDRGHPVTILSHAITTRRMAPGPEKRVGLLFVGALHPGTPNEDGLLWFAAEVLPLLRSRLKEMPSITVIGECSSAAISQLDSPDFRILGPQENLAPWYDQARVFIAPVRFAGGVPVKVIEAAANGIPVAASAILVRQLGWLDGKEILSGRDAARFASAIIRLLENDVAWSRQQDAARSRCIEEHHPESFARTVRSIVSLPEWEKV